MTPREYERLATLERAVLRYSEAVLEVGNLVEKLAADVEALKADLAEALGGGDDEA